MAQALRSYGRYSLGSPVVINDVQPAPVVTTLMTSSAVKKNLVRYRVRTKATILKTGVAPTVLASPTVTKLLVRDAVRDTRRRFRPGPRSFLSAPVVVTPISLTVQQGDNLPQILLILKALE